MKGRHLLNIRKKQAVAVTPPEIGGESKINEEMNIDSDEEEYKFGDEASSDSDRDEDMDNSEFENNSDEDDKKQYNQ